jgi:transposase
MKRINLPLVAEREKLLETPTERLVEMILRQQEIIAQLVEEVERLKSDASSDSRSSSNPPSNDIHKRSEQRPAEAREDGEAKRKPGAQPGHVGKTRKGFGRVDR